MHDNKNDDDRPAVNFSDPQREFDEVDSPENENRVAAAAAIVVVSLIALLAFVGIRGS